MSDYRPASAELTYPGPKKRGDKDGGTDKAVRRIQEWCSFHGSGTGIDGDFGPATEQALKNFQVANHLAATGILDRGTWERLVAPLHTVLDHNDAAAGEALEAVVVRMAQRHLAVHPVEIGGQNRGPWVRLYMRGKDGVDQLWCAGFSCFVLSQANAALGNAGSPIPYEVGVDALAADAKHQVRFVDGHNGQRPNVSPGSLFAERSASNPNYWIHTGIVIAFHEEAFQTIEGNANHLTHTNNGYEVCSKLRPYGAYDFIKLKP